jgi:hypothetical protein
MIRALALSWTGASLTAHIRRPGARAPVYVLALDPLAGGDGRGRCTALGGLGSVDVRFGPVVNADFHRPEPDERPAFIRDTRVTLSVVLGQFVRCWP